MTKVSNLVLSILVSSCVVTSISEFNRWRNFWLVAAMTFLSDRAFFSASSASLVHIIWMPSNPTWWWMARNYNTNFASMLSKTTRRKMWEKVRTRLIFLRLYKAMAKRITDFSLLRTEDVKLHTIYTSSWQQGHHFVKRTLDFAPLMSVFGWCVCDTDTFLAAYNLRFSGK